MCWTLNMHVYFVLIFCHNCSWILDMHVCFYCYFSSWLSLFSLSYFFCCTACYFQLEVDRKNPGKVGKVNDVDDDLGAPINYLLKCLINSSPPGQNDYHSIDNIFKYIFMTEKLYTVKCHYNTCHYNANASLTWLILGSQTVPICPHDHPRVAQHMGKRCEIIAVWSATAAMTPLCSHTNGMKQRYSTCWLCQYSRFIIDLRSNTLIVHLRCSENAIIRPIWLLDAQMLKTIMVAIKLT